MTTRRGEPSAGLTAWAYIGSRTTRERHARGAGITVCRVASDGSLTPVQVLGDLVNPSYLALNHQRTHLYAVHGDGQTCSAFKVHDHDGTLAWINTVGCEGRNPVHLALDASDCWLVVSNHLSGQVASIDVTADGALGGVKHLASLEGEPGPHRVEQPFSKPHFNGFDPSGRWVVVPDKGLDRLFVFTFDRGQLVPASVPSVATREGAGPRHVAFHPSGRWVVCVNELDSTLTSYRFDAATGLLAPTRWVSLLPSSYTGSSRASGVEMSADGRMVMASNRGADSIERFDFDASDGQFTHQQSRSCEGRTPRFFATHPRGHVTYVLNEDSDTVVAMARDPSTGALGDTLSTLGVGSPTCLVFR